MPAYRVTEPSGSLGEIQLGRNGSFDSDSEFVFSQATRRLGLGTSNPQYKLHIVGDAALGDTTVASILSNGQSLFNAGLSGSLTQLVDGTSYLIAGDGISIVTGTNGSVTISSTGGGGGGAGGGGGSTVGFDSSASYLVLSTTASLENERVLSSGLGILTTDGGSGGNFTLSVDDSVVATLSGSTFLGAVTSLAGFSGSLTQLADGSSYLRAGENVTITTGSDGAVTISSVGGNAQAFDTNASFLVLNCTSSLGNDRALCPELGLKAIDHGPGKSYSFSIDDSVVATLSGSTFSGAVTSLTGFSGSLTQLADGSSYLIAGDNVTITTGTNGAVTISAVTGSSLVVTQSVTQIIQQNFVLSKFQLTMQQEIPAESLVQIPGADFSTTDWSPANTEVFVNGQLMTSGAMEDVQGSVTDYTLAGSNQVAFAFSLLKDDTLVVKYIANQTYTRKKFQLTAQQEFATLESFQVDPSADFSRAAYAPQNIDLYINGEIMTSGTLAEVTDSLADYTLVSDSEVKFSAKIFADDTIMAVCTYVR